MSDHGIIYRKVKFKKLRVGDRFFSYPYSTHNIHAKKIRTQHGCKWADPLCEAPLRLIRDDEYVQKEIQRGIRTEFPKLLIVLALAMVVMGLTWLFVRWTEHYIHLMIGE